VKRLASKESVFEREFSILKRAKHRHIITLLAALKVGPTYYLIFPYSPANLTHFWHTEMPNPEFGVRSMKWVARQCKGLAAALAKIHRHETSSESSVIARLEELAVQDTAYSDNTLRPATAARRPTSRGSTNSSLGSRILYGRHGDIKPENILWFPGEGNESEQGTLKLSDFGTSELSTRQNHPNDSVPGLSPTYRPPECDMAGHHVVNSYWDVWSLGCLYLEFATWLLDGCEGLDEFRRRRRCLDTWCPAIRSDVFFESHRERDGSRTFALKQAVQQVSSVALLPFGRLG
jgi:serine/threonine protein kinase